MKLNRAQALYLVGTIAAVGCVVENSDDGGKDDSTGGAGGSGGDLGGSAGAKSTGGTAGTGTGGTSYGGTSGAGGDGGATCSDDEATPVSCDGFVDPGAGGVGAGGEGYGGAGGVGPSCEGMAAVQTLFCEDLWDNFKPVVANNVRTCMKTQTPEDLCTWDTTFGCATEAMLAACPDDSADDECETIATSCPDLAAGDCHAVLNGMTQAGRDMVVSCAAESLGYCNLWICAGVASPAGE